DDQLGERSRYAIHCAMVKPAINAVEIVLTEIRTNLANRFADQKSGTRRSRQSKQHAASLLASDESARAAPNAAPVPISAPAAILSSRRFGQPNEREITELQFENLRSQILPELAKFVAARFVLLQDRSEL